MPSPRVFPNGASIPRSGGIPPPPGLSASRLGWLAAVLFAASATALCAHATDAVWQWSVPFGAGRAYLWVPEDCQRVRALVLAQNNMIEPGILGNERMRRTLASLGIAEVLISPGIDPVFRFDAGAVERFDAMLRALADESGYGELADAPVIPLGHSAQASFPWNFAAANSGRTLAVLSVKGDAPQTDLTGSGRPNPDWGARTIDGIPGLMVMSEQEWWEARLTPLIKFRDAHPGTPLAVLADTEHGHFDASDGLVAFLAMFIRKAAEMRLPVDGQGPLRAIDPAQGWLVERWHREVPPRSPAAPRREFTGNKTEAFWCFDGEMARAVEAYQARGAGRKAQQVDFVQEGKFAAIATTHAGVELRFLSEEDGVSFRLAADFISPLPAKAPVAAKDKPPPPATIVPVRAAEDAHAGGTVQLSVITGPLEQQGPNLFRVSLNRYFPITDRRSSEVWLLAHHPGDDAYKGAVQQALLSLPRWTEGMDQVITFPVIPDQESGATMVALAAFSDRGAPVRYFVREGPALIRDGTLQLTPLPPRARLPVKITVVAWQFGRGGEPKLKAAVPVEQTFRLIAP